MKPTPAPAIWPYPGHESMKRTGRPLQPAAQRVMRGWWPKLDDRGLSRENTAGTKGIVDAPESHDNWFATFSKEAA